MTVDRLSWENVKTTECAVPAFSMDLATRVQARRPADLSVALHWYCDTVARERIDSTVPRSSPAGCRGRWGRSWLQGTGSLWWPGSVDSLTPRHNAVGSNAPPRGPSACLQPRKTRIAEFKPWEAHSREAARKKALSLGNLVLAGLAVSGYKQLAEGALQLLDREPAPVGATHRDVAEQRQGGSAGSRPVSVLAARWCRQRG